MPDGESRAGVAVDRTGRAALGEEVATDGLPPAVAADELERETERWAIDAAAGRGRTLPELASLTAEAAGDGLAGAACKGAVTDAGAESR